MTNGLLLISQNVFGLIIERVEFNKSRLDLTGLNYFKQE